MPTEAIHMNAIDLRFTAERAAILQSRISMARNDGMRVDAVEESELFKLRARLERHPIKASVRTYGAAGSLHLTTYSPELHERGCGYWYAVEHQAFAHTAFRQRSALVLWLSERGLSLSAPLPDEKVYSCQRLKGQYRQALHGSYDLFYSLIGTRTREVNNGDYTMAIITDDEDGIKTVNVLNCNCADRPKYDHAESDLTYC
jgi:hypothetical protein